MIDRVILSITTSGHGVGGCLCIDGKIVAANTLERLTRKRYDILLPISKTDLANFGWGMEGEYYKKHLDLPFDFENDYADVDFDKLDGFSLLMNHLLKEGGVTLKDVDCVAYSYRHNASAERFFKSKNSKIRFIVPEHHFAHACQAFLCSPYENAAIMVIDGQGAPLKRTNNDPLSGCLAFGSGNSINTLYDIPVLHSLGGFYAFVTKLCGFKTNEEGKTMGLAPYGTPEIYNQLKNNLKFYKKDLFIGNIGHGANASSKRANSLKHLYSLGNYFSFFQKYPRRKQDGEITDLYKDIAYSGQKIVEDVMIFLADLLYKETGSENLCIAGGVGLNCVANYSVLINSKFKNIFVYPNAGDNGLCVGQALYVHNIVNKNPRSYVAIDDYLGRTYGSEEIKEQVYRLCGNDKFEIIEHNDMELLCDEMASLIEDGKIASWWQGRSEFGPRALGNRSILADPRCKNMKDILNLRVKFRESFRPFAPSVLAEKAGEYFVLDVDSPYMLLAPKVRPGKEKLVPAITHVDNTARVQTVRLEENELYYKLIRAFERRTGIPMLLDTSFNVAGEPIVETPEDALRCFMSTDIDVLGIGKYLIKKKLGMFLQCNHSESWITEQAKIEIIRIDEQGANNYPDIFKYFRDPFVFLNGLTKQWNYLSAVKMVNWDLYLKEKSVVLDIGGGVGWLSAFISKFAKVEKVILVDYNKYYLTEMAPRIISLMQGRQEKVLLVEGFFTPLLNEDASVDMVLICSSLHHAENLVYLLKEASRVLKKDGLLFVLNETPESTMLFIFNLFKQFIFIFRDVLLRKFRPISVSISSGGIIYDPILHDKTYPLWYFKEAIHTSGFSLVELIKTGLPTLKNKKGPELVHFVCRKD